MDEVERMLWLLDELWAGVQIDDDNTTSGKPRSVGLMAGERRRLPAPLARSCAYRSLAERG
ncbi:MAG: hypothetical protein JWQ70_937 [Aeromicrobium sp.]|nr:hypothetical protein [Aeromicrobium sp.]